MRRMRTAARAVARFFISAASVVAQTPHVVRYNGVILDGQGAPRTSHIAHWM